MPMLVGLYLGAPLVSVVLRALGRNARLRRLAAAVLLYFSVVLPFVIPLSKALGRAVTVAPVLELNLFGAGVWGHSVWVLYFVLGHLLGEGLLAGVRKRSLAAAMAVALGLQLALNLRLGGTMGTGQAYCSPLVVLAAVCVFELVTRVDGAIADAPAAVLEWLSRRSYGVYCVHMFVYSLLFVCAGTLWGQAPLAAGAGAFLPALALVTAANLLLSYGLVALLSKVPPLRRWLFLMK